jgi:hypothetical protein
MSRQVAVGGMPASAAAGAAARIAAVITRLKGGAGLLTLRGAQVMAGGACQVTIITGSRGRLLDEAVASGLEVITEPALRAPIAPRSDLLALGRLEALFRARDFDVVHTHCAKAGAVGRLAVRRAGVPRIVHTYHGFPSISYSRLRAGRPTSRSSGAWAGSPTSRCASAQGSPRRLSGGNSSRQTGSARSA